MEKDRSIIELVAWLREQLGDTFTVTDHWEADLFAVGLSAHDDLAQLVYIGNFKRPAGTYTVALESAPPPGWDQPYREVGTFDSVNREQLLTIISQHLGITKSPAIRD